jgi:toxin ParE1/3/4
MATGLIVHWTPIATAHLREAYEYVAQDNVRAAESVLERIFSAVEMLQLYPQIGRAGRVKGTRELVIAATPFVVAYRSRRAGIEVLAVLHAARKWPEEFR